MVKKKKRMLDIIASVPNNFFDNLKPTEIILKLTSEYLKRYAKMKLQLFQAPTSI